MHALIDNSTDKTQLALLHRDKLITTLHECIERLLQTPPEDLRDFMRGQNSALAEWLTEENRLLAYIAGEKVEPKTLHAEAILVGVVGGGA